MEEFDRNRSVSESSGDPGKTWTVTLSRDTTHLDSYEMFKNTDGPGRLLRVMGLVTSLLIESIVCPRRGSERKGSVPPTHGGRDECPTRCLSRT